MRHSLVGLQWIGAYAVPLLGPLPTVVALLLLGVNAIAGYRWIILALTASFFVFTLNPYLYDLEESYITITRQLILAIACWIAVVKRKNWREIGPIPIAVGGYTLFIVIFSLYNSYNAIISNMKVGLFLLGTSASLLTISASREYGELTYRLLMGMLVAIAVVSIPAYFVESIGLGRYSRAAIGSGMAYFQGIGNHSQSFAIYMATLCAACLPIAVRDGRRKYVFLIILSLIWLYQSKGRTAVLSLVLSGLTYSAYIGLNYDRRREALRYLKRKVKPKVALLMAIAVSVSIPIVFPYVKTLVFKREGVASTREAFETSRLHQVLAATYNIQRHPWFGIGFGLPSRPRDLQRVVQTLPGTKIPISASVEKGFMPLAILEESGIVGSIVFIGMLGVVCRSVIVSSPEYAMPTLVLLYSNIGEMYFFAFNGIGLLLWMWIGICASRR